MKAVIDLGASNGETIFTLDPLPTPAKHASEQILAKVLSIPRSAAVRTEHSPGKMRAWPGAKPPQGEDSTLSGVRAFSGSSTDGSEAKGTANSDKATLKARRGSDFLPAINSKSE